MTRTVLGWSCVGVLAAACGGRAGDVSPAATQLPSAADAGATDAFIGDGANPAAEGGAPAAPGLRFEARTLPFSDIGFPIDIALGDVNGDGRVDVVLGNLTLDNRRNLLVFLQTGAGDLARPVAYTFGTSPLAVGDVNGDGRDDIVASTFASMVVAAQQADGTLAPVVVHPLPAPYLTPGISGILLTDVTADRALDVVAIVPSNASPPGPGTALVLIQTAGALGDPAGAAILGGGHAHVGDMNGDGLPDLVTTGSAGPGKPTTIGLLPLSSPGTFGRAYEANASGMELGTSFDVGDVNGDGADDIVTALEENSPYSKIFVGLQNHGALAFSPYDSVDVLRTVRIVDVSLDGRKDVVVAHESFGVGIYLQGKDGALMAEARFVSAYGMGPMAVGDIDGDGKPDIIVPDQQVLRVLYNRN